MFSEVGTTESNQGNIRKCGEKVSTSRLSRGNLRGLGTVTVIIKKESWRPENLLSRNQIYSKKSIDAYTFDLEVGTCGASY